MSNARVQPGELTRVLDLLDRVRREWHASRILEGLASFLSVGLAGGALLVTAAMFAPLPAAARWGLRAGWVAAMLAALVWLVLRRLFENPTDEEIALLIEKARPDLHNELINAVRLAQDPGGQSPPFVRAAIRESDGVAAGVRTRNVVSWRWLKRRLAVLAALAACWALLFGLFPDRSRNALERLLFPHRNLAKVGGVKIIEVIPGDATVVAGDNLEITAKVESPSSRDLNVRLLHIVAGGPTHEEAMQPTGDGRFRAVLLDIRSPRTYRVAAEDSLTRAYSLAVTERPMIKKISAVYEFPNYTGLEANTVEDTGGVIRAVKGTRARVTVEASKRLKGATVSLGAEPPAPLILEADRSKATIHPALRIMENLVGQVEITDEADCRNARPIQVVAVEDAPPQVKITVPGQDKVIGVGGSLDLAIRGTDDFGVVRAELYEKRIDVDSGQVREPVLARAWDEFPDRRNAAIHWRWEFPEKSYRNGDIVRYYVRMIDGNDVGEPGVGTSAEFIVRLQDTAALAQEREKKYGAWQAELEKVLKEQKELRQQVGGTEEKQEDAKP